MDRAAARVAAHGVLPPPTTVSPPELPVALSRMPFAAPFALTDRKLRPAAPIVVHVDDEGRAGSCFVRVEGEVAGRDRARPPVALKALAVPDEIVSGAVKVTVAPVLEVRAIPDPVIARGEGTSCQPLRLLTATERPVLPVTVAPTEMPPEAAPVGSMLVLGARAHRDGAADGRRS